MRVRVRAKRPGSRRWRNIKVVCLLSPCGSTSDICWDDILKGRWFDFHLLLSPSLMTKKKGSMFVKKKIINNVFCSVLFEIWIHPFLENRSMYLFYPTFSYFPLLKYTKYKIEHIYPILFRLDVWPAYLSSIVFFFLGVK